MNKTKRRKKKKIIIIIILLLLLLLCLLFYIRINGKKINAMEISSNQKEAINPNLTNSIDEQYFELVGFGQLEINKDNPCINLINPENNSVYLSFNVINNSDSLYSTKLIEPGKMEQFNMYSCLDAGEHTISYLINVYDLKDMKPLWTGIEQEQKLIVKK